MKNLIPLFFLFLPFFASGQINMELYGTTGKTFFTNDLIPEDNRIAFGGGIAFSGAFKNDKIHWVTGFQLSTIREKYENKNLRWGIQHDGTGGFGSANIDPALPNALEFKEAMNFIEAPIGIRYFLLDKKWRLFVQPTFAPSFYVTSHKKQILFYPNGNKTETVETGRVESIRKLGINGSFSAGVEMPISAKIKLLVMPQTGVSFFSLAKKNGLNNIQYSIGLRGGLQFEI